MDIQEVGRMLYTLRKEKVMSKEALCRGLCSVATLSRVEKGSADWIFIPFMLFWNVLDNQQKAFGRY